MKVSKRGASQVKLGQAIQSFSLTFLAVLSCTRERRLGPLPQSFLKEWAAFPQQDLKEVFYLSR